MAAVRDRSAGCVPGGVVGRGGDAGRSDLRRSGDRGSDRPRLFGSAGAERGGGVNHLIRVYRAILVAEFQAAAQYRVQSVLWLLFAIVRPVVFLAAWSAAAATQGGQIG